MARKARTRRRSKRGTRVLGGNGGYFDKSKNGEVTAIGKALRYIGGIGGSTLAPYAGAPPSSGAVVGRTLAAKLSKWLGYGTYKVGKNSLMDSSNQSIPMMHSSGQSVVVRHREYVGDIKSSLLYSKQMEMALNPGLSASFPWLSSVARQYQEYTWRGMVFHFIPTVGDAVSTAVPVFGNVMMHTEYRVTAPAPANKAELLNEYFSSDARPCESFIHPIECDPRENPYNVQYVRTGPVPYGEDAKTYDLGMFRAYSQGQGANDAILGEIWVSYEVELRKPQLSAMSGDGALLNIKGTISTTLPLGTAVTNNFNTLGITVSSVLNNGDIIFPKSLFGRFLVLVTWNPLGNLTLSGLSATFINCQQQTLMGGNGSDAAESCLPVALPTAGAYTTVIYTDGVDVAIVRINMTITNCNGVMVVVTRLPSA